MVNEEVIRDIINKCVSTVKCSQRLTLSASVKKAFKVCRDETCNPVKPRKSEKGYLFDSKGNLICDKSGNKSSVSFDSKNILKLFEKNGELHIDHNHPLYTLEEFPVFLSGSDVVYLTRSKMEFETTGGRADDTYVFKSITCEGANGTRMTMVRGDNFSFEDKSKITHSNILNRYQKDVIEVYKDLNDKITDRYYQIHDEQIKQYTGKIITKEMMSDWLNQATKEIIKEDGINLNTIFRKYEKEFREYNLKLSWETGL